MAAHYERFYELPNARYQMLTQGIALSKIIVWRLDLRAQTGSWSCTLLDATIKIL